MQHTDAVRLIEQAFADISTPQNWADLGAGGGTFTRALAALLPAGSTIYAVDKTPQQMKDDAFPEIHIKYLNADFEQDLLQFPPLDGILMANSLHYVQDQLQLIGRLKNHLSHSGKFIIVEYDTNNSNPWIPYPIPASALPMLFGPNGFSNIQSLGQYSSMYGRTMYARVIY